MRRLLPLLVLAIPLLSMDISPGAIGLRPESLQYLRQIDLPQGFQRAVTSIAADSAARRVAVVDQANVLYVLDGRTGGQVTRVGGGEISVSCVAVDPGGRWIAAGCRDGRVRLYGPDTPQLAAMLPPGPPSRREIAAVVAAPSGRYGAAVTADGTIYVFRVPGGNLVAQADLPRGTPQPGRVLSMTFARKETVLFFASHFRFYGQLFLDGGRLEVQSLPAEAAPEDREIYGAAASPDGHTIAFSTVDQEVSHQLIFDADRAVVTQRARLEGRAAARSVDFVAQGRYLAAASEWELWMWDATTWRRARVLRVHDPLSMGRPVACAAAGWLITAQPPHPAFSNQHIPARPARLYIWGLRPAGAEPRPGFIGVTFDRGRNDPRISQVLPDSAAEQGGLLAGDVILSIAGVDVGTKAEAISTFQGHREGEDVEIRLRRGEGETTLTVRLAGLPPGGPP